MGKLVGQGWYGFHMLHVLQHEHRLNFESLRNNSHSLASLSPDASRSANLLLFYAAEVGLKYLLNRKERVPFKHENRGSETVEGFSHDLPKMVARLKVSASRIPLPPSSVCRCINGFDDGSGCQKFEMKQIHEAWRYGLTVEPHDESYIISYLTAIVGYLTSEVVP